VFFDGGMDVVLEATEAAYRQAVATAEERARPDVVVETDFEWACGECGKGLYIEVVLKNNDYTAAYAGVLRIYVTEINARWDDYAGEQYHFALLDFALVENVSLAPGETDDLAVNWVPDDRYPDLDETDIDNLAVFAVLFNKTGVVNYAQPPGDNPFMAHVVDGVAAAIPENSPPSIAITAPKDGYLYLFGREIARLPKTVIVGPQTVTLSAYDESGIDRIELFVDAEHVATLDTGETWRWRGFGSHTLRAVAHDTCGQSATDFVNAFILA
jgi:hypothetical protein